MASDTGNLCLYGTAYPGSIFSLHQGGYTRQDMVQGIVRGLFPAGRVGKTTHFEEAGICLVYVGIETEINAVASYRKNQGSGR